MPYSEETVISYLQTGVEYCVTASVKPHFSKAIPSEAQCAFTSPPPRNSRMCGCRLALLLNVVSV